MQITFGGGWDAKARFAPPQGLDETNELYCSKITYTLNSLATSRGCRRPETIRGSEDEQTPVAKAPFQNDLLDSSIAPAQERHPDARAAARLGDFRVPASCSGGR
jgi:hypothetical protein